LRFDPVSTRRLPKWTRNTERKYFLLREIFDAPPVGRAFASELGIPLSDLGYSPARSEAEWDDVKSKLQIAAGKRLLQRLQPGRA